MPTATATVTVSPRPAPTIAIASPSSTASPTQDALADLGPTPTAPWTSVDWIAIPAGNAPTVPAKSAASSAEASARVNLFGWSRGFVDFVWDLAARTIVPWSSPDGVKWKAAGKLELIGFAAGFKDWDEFNKEITAEGYTPGTCDLRMNSLSEDPGGLLAFGWIVCSGAPCGSETYIGSGFWVSPDGNSWSALDSSNAFGGGNPEMISGGASGYIALGYADSKQAVWVSPDGHSWHRSVTPATPSDNADVQLTSPASFAGGFVLGGLIHWGIGACAYVLGPAVTPALWWSIDGTTWTQQGLSGGTAGNDATMSISRISDHALLAVERDYNRADAGDVTTYTAWTSADGRTWTPRQDGASLAGITFLTNGTRSLGYDDQHQLYSFDDDLNPAVLAQAGDAPVVALTGETPGSTWIAALGPTGLLVTVDGTRFWIGVPRSS